MFRTDPGPFGCREIHLKIFFSLGFNLLFGVASGMNCLPAFEFGFWDCEILLFEVLLVGIS